MLNQGGLDPQGLRYAAAGGQYQQSNFQALGGLQGLGAAAGRMGLAGFPNTSAAPQQGQYQGLTAGTAAGLQQGLRFMGPGVALGGGQMANQFPAGLNAVAAQRAQGLGQGIGQSLGQGLNLGAAGVRGGATAQQQAAAASLMLQRQQQQQQQQFGAAAAAQQLGGLGNLAGNPLQQLNAATQRQLALQQQQQQPQQQQQQQQSDLLALLAGGKTAAGHAGFGQGLGGNAAAAAGVQASHALFGARQAGGFAGNAGLGGGLGGLGQNLGPGTGQGAGLGMDALTGAAGVDGNSQAARAAQQQQQQQQQQQGGQAGVSPGFNADEFPALGAAVQAAAAAARGTGAVGPGQQQQAAAGAGAARPSPGAVDYSAAAMLRKGSAVGQEFSVGNDSDFPALGAGDDTADKRQLGQAGGADAPGATGLGGALTPAPAGAGGRNASAGLDRYGLLGLLHVIRMTEPDLTMLALGTDLTGLGLNLNSPDPLHKALVSPLSDVPVRADLDFEVPACYKHNPPRLQPGYLSKFKEETLFYIFYSMPQDEAQLIAADELCARGWWWHKKFRCWFIHAPNNPVVKNATARSERGTYLFFDTSIWDVVQKADVEVFFEDVERPPGLPRPSAASGAPNAGAAAGMQPQMGGAAAAAQQAQQQQQAKAAGQAAPAGAGLLRQ